MMAAPLIGAVTMFTFSWLQSRPVRYAAVPVLVAATTLVLELSFEPASSPVVALVYLLPVLVSTLIAGWVGGLVASLLSFLAFNYFFLPPYHTLVVANPSDVLALFVFLAVAGLVSYLLARARREAGTAQKQQHELAVLYDLSKAVSGQVGLDMMLQTIAGRISTVFAGSRCEVWLKPDAGALRLAAEAGSVPAPDVAPFEALIQSEHGPLGIIKLFTRVPPGADERLLIAAIAAQAAAVIERARLAQAATRARVLEESDRIKSALLSSISHDLRTPLVTIKAAVTGLMRRDLRWDEESLVDQLSAINEETDRLNRIIGNLLSMSRIEAGAVRLQKQPYALSEVMDTVLRRLAARTQAHLIKTDVPSDLPPVPLDYAAFEQIMTNLIDNAVKYSPPGAQIDIAARRVGNFVEIAVSDHGRGIPPEAQQSVFDKFYRADNSPRVPGSGLGLSIVKGFVEAHGGRAWISSQAGTGTRVTFLLPLEPDGEGAHEQPGA